LRMAESSSDPILLTAARHSMAHTLEISGNSKEASNYIGQVLSDESGRGFVALSKFLIDPIIGCLMVRLRSLWLFGYADQATKETQQALARISEDKLDPRTVCALLISACCVHQFCGRADEVRKLTEQGAAICKKHEFLMELQWVLFLRGWACSIEETGDEGIAVMRSALEFMHTAGALMFVGTYYVAILAQALMKADKVEEASRWLDKALDFVERSGHRFFEPELHRLKGEVACRVGASPWEVEIWFRRAIDVAIEQQARSLELRAAMSLARFLKKEGLRPDALETISRSYAAFTEGFDTADLREAAALRQELS
jgi:predicted ATPase